MTEYFYEPKFPVDTPPQRVVSLVPSITESLFDLNVGDRLIARTDFCVHPADKVAQIPTIGGTKNPDIDRIIALNPDLVIVNKEENRLQDAKKLADAGIPYWVTHPKTVLQTFALLWDIMELFDETTMVPRVRLIEHTYDWLMSMSIENENALPRVFVPIWLNPLMTISANTYLHDLLYVLGGNNAFAHIKPNADDHASDYPQITLAAVETAQPDVILLPSEPFHFSNEHVPIFKALDVPAAHHGRIHLVDGSLLTWHGTRIAYAMDQLPDLLKIEEPPATPDAAANN